DLPTTLALMRGEEVPDDAAPYDAEDAPAPGGVPEPGPPSTATSEVPTGGYGGDAVAADLDRRTAVTGSHDEPDEDAWELTGRR
ncbi:MAG: hypothetical protein ACRCY9_06755, partial [Phycicoccus sp.]